MEDALRPAELLDDSALQSTAVVANRAMNRERQLAGVNSYTRELGFNPLDVITARLAEGRSATDSEPTVGWLDLCCGTGTALIQAAEQVRQSGLADRAALVGVDLVDYFTPQALPTPGLELICAPLPGWSPSRAFDLITCVHGLHYVGDKLAVLAGAASWLTDTGVFVADLDLANIRLADGQPAGRQQVTELRSAGFSYDSRRHRVTRTGRRTVRFPYNYLGANHHAGANYTGQPAVHSYYTDAPNPL